MIYTLPEQVELYENTELLNWKKHNQRELLGHNLLQWHLDRQWKSIRKLAKNLGILLLSQICTRKFRDV